MLLPATLLALFASLIRIRRKQQFIFLLYLVMGTLSVLILYTAPQFISDLKTQKQGSSDLQAAPSLRDLAYPQKLIALQNAYLYFENKDNISLKNGFYIQPQNSTVNIMAFRLAKVSLRQDGLAELLVENGQAVSLESRREESTSFNLAGPLKWIINLWSTHNSNYLTASKHKPVEFIFICLLYTAFILSSSVFLRSSQWPLANIFLNLLVIFVILAIVDFVLTAVIPELESFLGKAVWLSLIPYGILAFVSALFFIFDFLLLPEKAKREEYA